MHFHLSDDQGWRIEIKSWPNLTKHGGSTAVGGGQGGYYTQEDYKDIVKYVRENLNYKKFNKPGIRDKIYTIPLTIEAS